MTYQQIKEATDQGRTFHLCGIGGVSMREQYAALENTEAFLQEKVARLRESAEKKRRSYRSLGALAGAMIAVILF